MAEFTIPLNDLRNEMRHWSFPITTQWLNQALQNTGLRPSAAADSGTLDVDAQRNGASDVLVQGRVRTKIVAECARCLGDAEINVDVPMTVLMSPLTLQSEHQAKESIDVGDDDLVREYFDGPELVLDDVVRQHIVLEEPMQPLCRPDCAGIEYQQKQVDLSKVETESGEAVDARLAPLLKFKQKLPSNEE